MALPLVRLVFCAMVLAIIVFGMLDYLRNMEANKCEMTYMFQRPQYLHVELDANVSSKYARYGLYLYGEGKYAAESRTMQLQGIPVLFIPGNAGSYKQVRSLGSVALQKAADTSSTFHFNYFSIDFNEELSGIYGGVLRGQTEYAAACVKHILTLYRGATSKPKSVVVVGHSMGGMVARGLFTVPKFAARLVHTIITQATPHQAPVAALDSHVQAFYDDVNTFWRQHHNTTLKEVTVVSTGGGFRDVLVRSHLTKLDGIVDEENAVSSNTMSVPRAFTSTDHLCHVWCKQIVLATQRALFNSVDKTSKQVAAGPSYRQGVFTHHLVNNPGSRVYKGIYDDVIYLDTNIKWEIRKKKSWATSKDSLSATRYSVVALPKYGLEDFAYIATSNIQNTNWLGVCSLQLVGKGKKQKREETCRTAVNLAQTAHMLPPFDAEKKAVHISPEDLEEQTHVIAILPQIDTKLEITAELYRVSNRHIEFNVTDLLTFMKGIPHSFTSLEVLIPKTEAGAVFYNVTLRGLTMPLQAYSAYITCLDCSAAPPGSNVIAKLHVPWGNEDTYAVIPAEENGTVSLKLQSGRPDGAEHTDAHAQLHLYLHPACTYRVAIALAWPELFGQFVRFYAYMLPVFLVINIIMALSYQLKQLDEEGLIPDVASAHAQYGQPWRVVPLAVILRFMLYFPEELPLASRLYLPADDSHWLRAQHVWYPALPVLLYVSANAIVAFYTTFITAAISVLGRVVGLLLGRCCLGVRCVAAAAMLEYIIYAACVLIACFTCGTIALILIYLIFFVKTLWSYVVAKYGGFREKVVWNTHNVYVTLLITAMMMVVLNAPPLMAWLKNLSTGALTLEGDTSRSTAVAMTVVAVLFSYGKFPRIANDLFGAVATIVYACSVIMILFCMTSVYRISYYITFVLFLVAFAASTLNYSAKSMENSYVSSPKIASNDESENGTKVSTEGDKVTPQAEDEISSASDSSAASDEPPIEDTKARLRKRSAKKV